jgi:YfiH family protein
VAERLSHELGSLGVVHAVFSDRTDGDMSPRGVDPATLRRRRAALAPLPWTWLDQVHGARVCLVGAPGQCAGESADASVTACAGATLSVQVADCAPVLLFSPAGPGVVVAATHAGWRGLEAGVLEETVRAMGRLGGTEVSWWVGPCISAAEYEFSATDLDRLSARLGEGVRSTTKTGTPALDMAAALDAAMDLAGVHNGRISGPSTCTATSDEHWSHRRAEDPERQVGAIWWEPLR